MRDGDKGKVRFPMSTHDFIPHQETAQELFELGAWLVPLRGFYGRPLPEDAVEYDRWKLPKCSWKDRDKCARLVQEGFAAGSWYGVIPSSLGLVVIDLDEGDKAHFAGVLQAAGFDNWVEIPTGKPGRAHFVLRAMASWPMGNWKWSWGDGNAKCSGEIRYDKGYVIVWDPEKLLEATELPDDDGADSHLAKLLGGKVQTSMFGNEGPLPDIEPGSPRTGTGRGNRASNEPDGSKYPPGDRDERLYIDLNKAAREGEAAVQRVWEDWMAAPRQKGDHEDRFYEKLNRIEAEIAIENEDVYDSKSAEVLRQCLTKLGYAFAFNERSGRFEWKVDGKPVDYGNRTIPRIIEEVAARFKYSRPQGGTIPLRFAETQFVQFINALSTYPGRTIDDFKLWLEREVPDWDGKARLSNVLRDLFGVRDEDLGRWASEYLFLGAIQRTYEPACKLDELPVLIGEQGIGKSAILEWLFPTECQGKWYCGTVDMNATPRERIEAIRGAVVVELAEMAGIGRELQKQKQWLTIRTDRLRLAYARDSEAFARRFSFVGTADRLSALPNDPAGNRRFVAIELERGANVQAFMAEHRSQLWAEALHRYHEGERANLPRDLMERQKEVNQEFTRADEDMDEAIEKLDRRQQYSLAEIVETCGLGKVNNRDRYRLTNALLKAGWRQSRVTVDGKKARRYRSPDYEAQIPF